MIIREINEKPETSAKAVAILYHKSGDHKTMFIGFKQGMTLDQHRTHLPARHMVITGNVSYIQADVKTHLGQYDFKDIPINIIHEILANEDSLCMLIQG